ncbi:MAG TPA: ABC transporter permease subunit [Patescibacteria group bacterium]|nr:ABC transporter permease subunit [Patescibacteria group bacterium]
MFNSIFLKTLREKRWSTAFWSLGVIAMALLMMAFYHSFSAGGFDEVLKNVPKSFQGLVGNLASLKTVPGYVSQEVFSLRIPLLTLIMGIILFTGLLAGDEGDGTLQTLLAQPVSRLRVYIEKLLAGLVISAIICSMAVVGVWLGLLMIHEQMSLLRLIQAVFGVWLLTCLFGSIGFALGAITGKRSLAGSVTGLLAFGTYLLTSFAPNVTGIAQVEKFSPFHYYNHPAITEYGLKGSNTFLMVGVSLVCLVIAAWVFWKRDIYR